MGHRRTRQQYKLTFEKPDHMIGLEVTCYGPTRKQLFAIAKLADVDLDNLVGEGIEELDRLATEMADRIVEWNHEDEDGTPLPPTRQVLDEEDPSFSIPLVRAWMQTCVGTTPEARVDEVNQAAPQFDGQTSIEDQLAELPMK